MKKRQAVILIHGIGEQRPLETLRSFVRNVVGSDRLIRNKPDKMSTLFELRRLQLPGDKKNGQPLTDFYEYYWAHHMRDTKFRMIISWLKTLLWRSPCSVSPGLRPFYFLLWGFALALPVLFFFGYHKIVYFLLAASTFGFWLDYNVFRITYGKIDDAARYLNPTPDNIAQRNTIRKEGITLLKTLHESGKYNRIVLVGHSLGSVIAYDLIRLYWATQVSRDDKKPRKREFLKEWRKKSEEIFNNEKNSINTRVELYQQLQNRTWLELRDTKYPWLIHDLITIGSPLAHGELLMAKKHEEFQEKKDDGEYPCSPPGKKCDISFSHQYTLPEGTRNTEVPTDTVPFICTRWTNIYFPYRRLIMGDLIGGPLRPVFGPGIRDVEVGLKGRYDTLLSHTSYWAFSRKEKKKKECKHPIEEIINALRLDIEKGKTRLPSA